MTFTGSYSRVKAHLLKISGQGIRGCTKVTLQCLNELKKENEEAEFRAKDTKSKSVPLPPFSSQGQSSSGSNIISLNSFPSKKRKGNGDTPLEKAFNLQAREQLQSEIARMFYTGGLSFNLARNPHYISSYTYAANHTITGYIPPGVNMLRTTLLQKERAHVENLLEPIKGTWSEKGISIICDGRSDPQRRPLINFMAVTEDGPMFLKTINNEGVEKDKYYIATLIKEVLLEVGPSKVVQITDNAHVCRAAGRIIEQQFSHIFWTPYVVHTLNLALKNICAAKNTENNSTTYEECKWITEICDDVMVVKNFIMNHSIRLSMFNKFVPLKLLAIAATRFASFVVMLERFKFVKRGVQSMVISDEWLSYKEDDIGKVLFVKDKILDDIWWDKIDYILSFTDPIYAVLRRGDTDKPCLHLIYEMWDSMIEKVKVAIYRHERKLEDEESQFYSIVYGILVDRWTKNCTPLYCLAHFLNPRYYSNEWLKEDKKRIPPHKDVELVEERNNCLKRYFPNVEERRLVNLEYAAFSGALGPFAESDSLCDRAVMDAKSWWLIYGVHRPTLQTIALKLFGHPNSFFSCERNWSTYLFIHSLKRSNLAPQRAEDLVFVHTNLRLLSRRKPQYQEGFTKMWDIAGDSFDSFNDIGILELANLSLDEPELEKFMLTDEDHEDEDVDAVEIISH